MSRVVYNFGEKAWFTLRWTVCSNLREGHRVRRKLSRTTNEYGVGDEACKSVRGGAHSAKQSEILDVSCK